MTLICDLFVEQAGRRPDALAVRTWEKTLTYGELDARSSALAAVLVQHGVGPDSRVGISHRRDPSMVVAMLAIQRAGGAYVPLDPTHPPARNRLVIDDAGISIAVVDDAGAAALAGDGLILVPSSAGEPGPAPVNRARPGNAAYVLYTSGSTGLPKGVVVTHANAVAYITTAVEMLDLGEWSRCVGFAALGWDVSVLDTFASLISGGSLALVPERDKIDPTRLQTFMEEHQVTWGLLPPALLPLLDPDRLPSFTHAITGGESPGPEQVARWSAPPGRRFINWYGPTETTIVVVGAELTGTWDTPVPIGHALPDCAAYILDEQMLECPVGTPGELLIGGPQVSRGYLGRPALTADRFIPDPFSGVPGSRLYRTGDLVVRDPDHGIIYLGRLDRQVKVSGQRVELGEIESVLRGHPGVAQAITDVSPSATGLPELVAYLAPATAPDLIELRDYCTERLPVYMTPTRVVRLDTLPLNNSGKVDMAALRAANAPVAVPAEAAGLVAYSPMERAVATVWSRVLGVREPGLDDDFFASGGHSLLAMRLVAAVRAELGRAVTVEEIVEGRTLAGFAARVAKAEQTGTAPLRTGQPPVLSAAQRRVWFVDRLAKETPAYNIALAERLHGPIDVDALAVALRAVAARHEVLRWRFPDSGGVPYVHVDPADTEVPLPVVPVDEATLREQLERVALERFDLAAGPLWRARLLRLDETEHVLAITVHHAVFDGWSQEVLYRDLGEAYAIAVTGAEPVLDPLPATFADYVGWLRDRDAADSETALTWWTERLRGAPTVLDLPRDHARPPVQTFTGSAVRAEIPTATADAVRELAVHLGTTPYAVLLAAFAQHLRRLTGQRDLIIGAPIADRRHPAFEPMIGFCVDTVPLRLTVDDGRDFTTHVRACGDTVMASLAQAETPLERIVGSLGVDRDLSRNPLVQVLFNMYNFAEPHLHLTGVTAEPVQPGLPGSLFDLTLYVSEQAGGFALQAVFNPDLFDADRIEALLAGYPHLVGELATAPDRPVGAASLRPATAALPHPDQPLARWSGPGVVERIAASSTSDTVAITGTGGELTHRELHAVRAGIGAAIRAAGIPAGTPIAVLATRDTALPAILLGTLASGAKWAVLDASLPPARLAAQARAAGCCALLACPGAVPPAELAHLPVVPLAPTLQELVLNGGANAATLEELVPAEQRGYVSFTSGTTGEPKAVLTGERALAHYVDWAPGALGLRADDRFALLGGLAHDPLLRDVFLPLALGATLHVPPQDLLRDPVRLTRWLADAGVTVLHLTPQLLRLLTAIPDAALPGVRLVATGGDQLTAVDVVRLRAIAPGARVVNLYGTTETPQAQGFHPVADDLAADSGAIPVGRGIDGAQLLVLGPAGQPAGVGELGELVIRSRYLAHGYATEGRLDHDRTASRFRATDPDGGDEEDRMYDTGDLGRYRPDGEVVLAGRDDDQVKIRGFRLELGEVTSALLAHPEVRTATAIADTENAEVVVRAYAVAAGAGLTVEALRTHLGRLLPAYAMPSSLTLLPAMPLTANGKVDRAALPRPSARPRSGAADEPTTPTERVIATVWREILALPRVGVTDNFFEVGGHSLAIVAVQTRLGGLLSREIDILDLFRHPNIRALGAHLDGANRGPGLDRAAQRIAARRDRNRRTTTARPGGAAPEEGSN
ncbi:amino acid adenylation domain-containing protein [Allocatelliglobosispora scoriae]|uniref:Amino acid adenylation domain-containing protein n=1 Tax=Allocatelliglobosispora scoriae TaxID=643052 RepID=A0A841C061_9ACTN|nr:non-ribosomal peptide synthetase [Allocatelliglobosispora scoriae]MBB5873236.1 amino acid adenylation domain-containing protein [Allocatelliglobosispora scoriae]